tara:strand:+ start:669 stop:1388 length:720 start_codon:yes stop_codon:yes gene_type:complete
MAITAFNSIEQLNSILDVVKALSTDDTFEENWSKVNSESYEDILKNLEKKLRKSKKNPKKAYTAFTSDLEVQEKITNGKKLSIGEKSKAMSLLWKSMTSEEKQKYQSIADQYNIDNNIESTKDSKAKKTKTKYNMFLADKEYRENISKNEGSKLLPLQLHKLIISKYKTLTKEQLDKYQEQADKFNEENNLTKSTKVSSSVAPETVVEEKVIEEVIEEEEMSPKLSEMKKKKKKTVKKK